MLIRLAGSRGLQSRFDGTLHQLFQTDGVLRYSSAAIDLEMDAESLTVHKCAPRDEAIQDLLVDPDRIGAMIVIHRAFQESMPEYPLVEAESEWLIPPAAGR